MGYGKNQNQGLIFCLLLSSLFFVGCSKPPEVISFASTACKKINNLVDFNNDKKSELVFWNTSSMSKPGKYLESCFYEIVNVTNGKITKVSLGEVGDIPLLGYFDEDSIIDYCLYRGNFNSGSEWFIKNGGRNDDYNLRIGKTGDLPVPNDFDGDSKCDAVSYDPQSSTFRGISSRTGASFSLQFGVPGSIPVIKDYDGDGAADFTTYKPSSGIWTIKNSSNTIVQEKQLGGLNFLPIPSDYDGDGQADLCVWNNITGEIKLLLSSLSRPIPVNVLEKVQNYIKGKDLYPVPMDYDGNGISELAFWDNSSKLLLTFEVNKDFSKKIYHFPGLTNSLPVNNYWLSNLISKKEPVLGIFNDGQILEYKIPSLKATNLYKWDKKENVEPFVSDFDGDFINDSCLYSKDSGTFFCNSSRGGLKFALSFGQKTDIPLTGMFNKDNITDIGVFRPQTNTFYIRYLGKFMPKDIQLIKFSKEGVTGTIPEISDYDGDGIDDLAVYNPDKKSYFVKYSSGKSESTFEFCKDTICKSKNNIKPITGDFDGDGKVDPGIISSNQLSFSSSLSGKLEIQPLSQDISGIPFSRNFDNDLKSDIVVLEIEKGILTILESSKNWKHTETMLAGIVGKHVKLVNNSQ